MLKSVSWQQVVLCVAALAAILAGPKLMGADYANIVQVVLVIFASFAGGKPPSDPPPPSGPGPALKLVACLAFFSFIGCHGGIPARAPARAVVLAEASGIRVVARACSDAIERLDVEGKEEQAMSLAEKCEEVVNAAQRAVLTAARAVDNWNGANAEHDYLCAVQATYNALLEGARAVEAAGFKPAEALADALEVARPVASLAKDCK